MGRRLDVLDRCHLAIVLRLSYKLDYGHDENPVYTIWRLPRRCRPTGPDNRHGLHRSAAGGTSCGYDVGNHDIGRYAGGDATASPSSADAPIQATASPLDAIPEAIRLLVDKPFTGDFDQMVKRRVIRVGMTFNRTHYFIDKGQERGLTYEALKAFENDLNTDLKTGNLKVHVAILPMSRDLLVSVPFERQGRHDCGHGDRPARTGSDRGHLRADADEREPGGGHGAGSAGDCHGGRSGRQVRCSSEERARITTASPS